MLAVTAAGFGMQQPTCLKESQKHKHSPFDSPTQRTPTCSRRHSSRPSKRMKHSSRRSSVGLIHEIPHTAPSGQATVLGITFDCRHSARPDDDIKLCSRRPDEGQVKTQKTALPFRNQAQPSITTHTPTLLPASSPRLKARNCNYFHMKPSIVRSERQPRAT